MSKHDDQLKARLDAHDDRLRALECSSDSLRGMNFGGLFNRVKKLENAPCECTHVGVGGLKTVFSYPDVKFCWQCGISRKSAGFP